MPRKFDKKQRKLKLQNHNNTATICILNKINLHQTVVIDQHTQQFRHLLPSLHQKPMHLPIFLLLFSFQSLAIASDKALIAVASNLRPAMQEISQRFEQQTGIKLRISYASSGILSQQILHGAPFELFISANQRFVERLPRSLVSRQQRLAFGQLALMMPLSSVEMPDPYLRGLSTALSHNRINHFVIANPDHAPFGLASRQVLKQRQLWQAVQPFLIRAENAAQAVHYIASGMADAGLVPYSLALTAGLQKTSRHVLLAPELQPRLPQTVALLKTAGADTHRLYDFLQQPVCRAILQQHGYQLPQKQPNGLDRF